MTRRDDVRSTHPLSDDDARRLLTRAAELDVARASDVSIAQLRDIAREAGIAPAAFESALGEPAFAAPSAGPRTAVPLWVRVCMFGVPDRAAAKAYYWLFVAGLCASPLLAWQGTIGARPTALLAGAFLTFAAWSTSRAIRWLDENGWELLP
jgi:hypothetical protein